MLTVPLDLALHDLVPSPDLFHRPSVIHGQAHVARVMVHAFRLLDALGWSEEAPRLWAAVYLHDLARRHDGVCPHHGQWAAERLPHLAGVRVLFTRGGVRDEDVDAIATAVTWHSRPQELDRDHPHWRLTSLLKDADALDRVRIDALDPRYLRHEASHTMIPFAWRLHDETNRTVATGRDYFPRLWGEAERILKSWPFDTCRES